MEKACCENCLYFKDDEYDGECRRYPPLIRHALVVHGRASFPTVEKDDVCGEWRCEVSVDKTFLDKADKGEV